jgi:hypothetical protein
MLIVPIDKLRQNEYNFFDNRHRIFVRGATMNGYVQAKEIAERWNVSTRQVQLLCNAGKIDGAVKFGTTWAIPEDAVKPKRTGKFKPGRKPKTNAIADDNQSGENK